MRVNGMTCNMVAPERTAGARILSEGERMPISRISIGRRVSIDEVVDAIRYFLGDGAGAGTEQCDFFWRYVFCIL